MSSPELLSIDKPQIIIAAGMGCRATTLGMLSLLVEESRNRGLRTEFIDGSFTNASGNLEVSTPSRQLRELEEKVDGSRRSLIVAHCGGSTPLLDFLEAHSPSDQVKGVAIAPPFESPEATMALGEVQASISTEGSESFLDVYDTPADDPYSFSRRTLTRLVLSRAFGEEVSAKSPDFLDRAKQLATAGSLGIVIPQADWNKAAIHATRSWDGPILRIDDARHSLRMPSGTLDSQRQACRDALDFGFGLLES